MKTPLELASLFECFGIDHKPDGWPAIQQHLLSEAAALLRTQHAEIEASNRNLEQLTDELAQCRREIERKNALLRQCLKHVASNITRDGCEAEELYDTITKELQ